MDPGCATCSFAKTLLLVFLPLHMLPCFYKLCSDVCGFGWLQGAIVRSAVPVLSSSLPLDSRRGGWKQGGENLGVIPPHRWGIYPPRVQHLFQSWGLRTSQTTPEQAPCGLCGQKAGLRTCSEPSSLCLIYLNFPNISWDFFLGSLPGLVVHAIRNIAVALGMVLISSQFLEKSCDFSCAQLYTLQPVTNRALKPSKWLYIKGMKTIIIRNYQ